MISLVESAGSGSMQTSGGGDSDSLSAIFHYSATVVAAIPTPPHPQPPSPPPPPPPPPSCILNYQPFFDPISYLDSTTPFWPRALSASASGTDFPSLTNSPAANGDAVNSLDDQAATAASAPRSSKKRTRSSRREPTTVLTTDTSNFRAMVQQFTGVPSFPFDVVSVATSSSSLFGGSRFDLLGSSASAAFGSSSFLQPSPFLRRPFPQLKLVRVSPSSATNPTISYRPSVNNIQIPSHGLGSGSCQSLVSPMITLQSLLPAKCTAPPAMPAVASCSTKAQISTPAPLIELQPEVPDGGKGDGRYRGRLMD